MDFISEVNDFHSLPLQDCEHLLDSVQDCNGDEVPENTERARPSSDPSCRAAEKNNGRLPYM